MQKIYIYTLFAENLEKTLKKMKKISKKYLTNPKASCIIMHINHKTKRKEVH